MARAKCSCISFGLPIAFFGSRFAGEIASRLDLSDDLAGLLTGQVAQVVLNLVTASFFLVLMLAYDPASRSLC